MTTIEEVRRSIIYRRVSSAKQIPGYSLDNQEIECRKKAVELHADVIKCFSDEGESAKTTDRPQFQQLLHFCRDKKNKIHYVIVYHSSRIARNTLDFLLFQRDMAKYGVTITSCTEANIGQDNPESKLISTVFASINEYENENRARNVRNGMKRRFLSGYPTSPPPFGYTLIKKQGEKSKAIPAQPAWDYLQKLWYRIPKERLSFSELGRELSRRGLGKRFNKRSAESIFTNKFYAGYLVSQKYGEVEGKHDPMIPLEHFYICQKRFNSKNPYSAKRSRFRKDFALRGLLKCPTCSRSLTSCYSKGRNKHYPYYICSYRDHKLVNIPRDIAEKQFGVLLRTIKPQEDYLTYYLEIIRSQYESSVKPYNNSHDTLVREIDELKELLPVLMKKNAKGIYGDEEYLAMKNEIEVELIDKKQLLTEKKLDIADIDKVTNFMKRYLLNLDEWFIKSTPEGRFTIGDSIFPKGLVFENGIYRIPTIAPQYKQISDFVPTSDTMVSREVENSNDFHEYLLRFYHTFQRYQAQIPLYT